MILIFKFGFGFTVLRLGPGSDPIYSILTFILKNDKKYLKNTKCSITSAFQFSWKTYFPWYFPSNSLLPLSSLFFLSIEFAATFSLVRSILFVLFLKLDNYDISDLALKRIDKLLINKVYLLFMGAHLLTQLSVLGGEQS